MVPIVKAATFVTAVVPHALDTNAPHVPLYNCILGLVILAPKPLNVIVSEVAAATKEYQTS